MGAEDGGTGGWFGSAAWEWDRGMQWSREGGRGGGRIECYRCETGLLLNCETSLSGVAPLG